MTYKILISDKLGQAGLDRLDEMDDVSYDMILGLSKEELMAAYQAQRAATLAALDKQTADDFDKPSGVDYAPTVGAMFAMQGAHWLMHCGQWVIIRRLNGKPVVI